MRRFRFSCPGSSPDLLSYVHSGSLAFFSYKFIVRLCVILQLCIATQMKTIIIILVDPYHYWHMIVNFESDLRNDKKGVMADVAASPK